MPYRDNQVCPKYFRLRALCAAESKHGKFTSGALANLTVLALEANQIGDVGMTVFSEAVASRAVTLGVPDKLSV